MAEIVRSALTRERLPVWSARFVAFSGHVDKNGRVKPAVFKPLPNPCAGNRLECSVTLHDDPFDEAVVRHGERFAQGLTPPKKLLGWVDLPTNDLPALTGNCLYVERSPSRLNPDHANLLGFPDTTPEAWRLMALKLIQIASTLKTPREA